MKALSRLSKTSFGGIRLPTWPAEGFGGKVPPGLRDCGRKLNRSMTWGEYPTFRERPVYQALSRSEEGEGLWQRVRC